MSKDAGGPYQELEKFQQQLEELKRENEQLRRDLNKVAQASTFENVVQQGFDRISTQLEPLRDMSARREFPGTEAMQKFAAIQGAIAQPQWRGSNFEADSRRSGDTIDRGSQS